MRKAHSYPHAPRQGRGSGNGGGEAGDRRALPPFGRTPLEDLNSVMAFHRLPVRFAPHVLKEARAAARKSGDVRGRLDLRRKFIFTCDPESAKDYDDAISLDRDSQGHRVLGVHIADVSHYVRPGGALDKEAFLRANSVYFPGKVVPMLPETLSNGICSLVPGEDRLAFSVFIVFDASGAPSGARFAKSVIRSKARYEYGEVSKALRGEKTGIPPAAARRLRAVSALAEQLRARRFAAGALDIELPERQIVLGPDGEMTGLESRVGDESHRMIEECMIAANEAVAAELSAHGVKTVSRCHEAPDAERLEELAADLRGMGVKTGSLAGRRAFAAFLAKVKTHPLHSVIALMVLRSMKRALYDCTATGHFGLAKRHYAHFTSPIRRYADLVLHRQMSALAERRDARIPPDALARRTDHLNAMEENAALAEREFAEMKKIRFLESRRGEVYSAIISKCTKFGCFADIPEIGVSGLVHVSVLDAGYVRFCAADNTLRSSRGRVWRPGDRMDVKVLRIDRESRHIDFVPA